MNASKFGYFGNRQALQLIDEKEVAQILGVSLQTLRNHRNTGRGLPYHKLGRLVRYDLSDVLRYLEQTKIQTVPVPGDSRSVGNSGGGL